MATKLNILAASLNGQILETPVQVSLNCDTASYVGIMNVRDYDENNCIVVKKLFVVKQGNDLFGTSDFKTIKEFIDYRNANCIPCGANVVQCGITIGGCYILYKGCYIQYK